MKCECGKEINGSTSDGYHTFDQLYEHRCLLFCLAARNDPTAWKSKRNADGSTCGGWFVAGIDLASGGITYHLPIDMWDIFDGIEVEKGVWDGHTGDDVIERMKKELTLKLTKAGFFKMFFGKRLESAMTEQKKSDEGHRA